MPRRSPGGTLSVPMSKPRYTAVESQLMISPPRRSASSMPSALVPVAVGPRMASIGGRRWSYVLKMMKPMTNPSRISRPSCCGRVGTTMALPEVVRVFVVEERHREKRRVRRVLRGQRLRRIRAHQRVHRREVERLDARRLLDLDVGKRAVAIDVEGNDDVPLHDHRGLRHEPVALHLRSESAQPWAEVDPSAVELDEPL